MRLIFVFITLILSFNSIAQSKKKQIYQLNQEVTSLKYKVNKLEIIQSKYADSMKMMHAKYSEDIKILMLQIDLLNNKKNKTRLENERTIFIKDSSFTSQMKITENKIKAIYDSIEHTQFQVITNDIEKDPAPSIKELFIWDRVRNRLFLAGSYDYDSHIGYDFSIINENDILYIYNIESADGYQKESKWSFEVVFNNSSQMYELQMGDEEIIKDYYKH